MLPSYIKIIIIKRKSLHPFLTHIGLTESCSFDSKPIQKWQAAARMNVDTLKAQTTCCSMPAIQKECISVMRIFFFPFACTAPAIITILSCPQGSYYSVYINSHRLLHFVCARKRRKRGEKNLQQLQSFSWREKMARWIDLTVVSC